MIDDQPLRDNGLRIPEACLVVEADTYVPQRRARGPWGQSVQGGVVGGLLARTIEHEAGESDFQPARLTVDLLRPVLMEPMQVQTSMQRTGRRIKLADAALIQRGIVVARASALFLLRSERSAGEVWTHPVTMPPLPAEPEALLPGADKLFWSYSENSPTAAPDAGFGPWQQAESQKFGWLRQLAPLVEGETLTPFTRVALAGDVTSPLTHWGTHGLQFINADYTLSLSRLPDGEYVGLASLAHYSDDGVATGVATFFDHQGPIGNGMATGLAQPAGAFVLPELEV